MQENFDILGVGTAVVDDLLILPEFPTQNTRIDVLQRKKQVGGSVPMALKTLSVLGCKTAMVGKIGDDEDSRLIKKYLSESGIDVKRLIEEKGSNSAYAQVWMNLSNGTRTMAIHSGNISALRERNIDFNDLPECKILHIDGKEHDVVKKLIEIYREKGAKISIDTGRFRERTPELIDLVDVIIIPLSFALDWIGKFNFVNLISKAGQKYPDKLIVITDGQMGSVASYYGEIFRQKAFKVNCVDSTGVGGVFAGGMLYGVLNGWEIPEALEFAAAAGAISCRKVGNAEMPGYNEVEGFLGEQ